MAMSKGWQITDYIIEKDTSWKLEKRKAEKYQEGIRRLMSAKGLKDGQQNNQQEWEIGIKQCQKTF